MADKKKQKSQMEELVDSVMAMETFENTLEEELSEVPPDSSMTPQEYESYVKQLTPTHSTFLNVLRAFLVGGIICCLGQAITAWLLSQGIEKEAAGTWTSICLVGTSIILTGFNVFGPLAKFGGAGALVPITGFANAMVSPAIEYKKEGWVFGVGCKIFTIAGPVILYGVLTSWIVGVIAWILGAR